MYPSGLTITPEPRPWSVCLPYLCGSCPPKNWRSASSENGNGAAVRDTVWVVNTVTTLGATFSTTAAKLAITPGCIGAVSCAAGEEALIEPHRLAPISNLKGRKIPLCINVSSFRGIARSTADGPLLTRLATKVECVVLNSLARLRPLPPVIRAFGDFLCHRLRRSRSTPSIARWR